MKTERAHYDKSYKIMAVELAEAKESIRATAEEIGIEAYLISRWRREQRKKGSASFSGNGKAGLTEEQREIDRLRKELQETQIERDILKKAPSIFSKSDGKYFEFIMSHYPMFAIEKMCKVLKVSRSGYYQWLSRKPSTRR